MGNLCTLSFIGNADRIPFSYNTYYPPDAYQPGRGAEEGVMPGRSWAGWTMLWYTGDYPESHAADDAGDSR